MSHTQSRSTLTDDAVYHICTKVANLHSLATVSKQWHRIVRTNNLVETCFVRSRGYLSLAHFRQALHIDDSVDISTVLKNITTQLKHPDVRTEHDGIFLTLFWRVARKCDSSLYGAGSLRRGEWNGRVAGIMPTKKDGAWLRKIVKSHPDKVITLVESMRDWDDAFS